MARDVVVLEHASIGDSKVANNSHSCCNIGPGYATPLEAMAGPKESLIYVTCVYTDNGFNNHSNSKLLDCPGAVMLKSGDNDAAVVLRNCKRIEKLQDPVGPVKEILKLCPAETLTMIHKLHSFDSVDDYLFKVATLRGKLKKGGIVDIGAAARIVLHDWNEGKIPFYTMPPTRNEGEVMEANIVSELGKEFNVDEVYGTDSTIIGSLKSINDFNSATLMSDNPVVDLHLYHLLMLSNGSKHIMSVIV